jgi:hypothetical protein
MHLVVFQKLAEGLGISHKIKGTKYRTTACFFTLIFYIFLTACISEVRLDKSINSAQNLQNRPTVIDDYFSARILIKLKLKRRMYPRTICISIVVECTYLHKLLLLYIIFYGSRRSIGIINKY